MQKSERTKRKSPQNHQQSKKIWKQTEPKKQQNVAEVW